MSRHPRPVLALLSGLAVLLLAACEPPEYASSLESGDPAAAASSQGLAVEEPPAVGPGEDAVWVSGEGALDASAGKLRVTMVDVGQGDGFVVEFPNGKVLVVDGGPSSTKLANHLSSRGITQIDYAVLSHGHNDHYAGLTPVLSLLPGDCAPRVFDPGLNRRDVAGYNSFRSAAGCNYQAIRIGATLLIDPAVEVTVLSAHSKRVGSSDDSRGVNNTSVILRIRYGRFSILFEGDAESDAERLTYDASRPLLRSTVLKAGHHGSCSSTATSYLSAVAPQYVLISVSDGNSYGMPHCQTMGKLKRRAGLRWARTDENGTVRLTSDGTRYSVSRAKGRESEDSCPRDCASPQDF
jgi:competence protein ComEC